MTSPNVVEEFRRALVAGDAAATRALLTQHADVRAAINAPVGDFGGRPVTVARKNLPLLDVLLEFGADINLKSDWRAGPFGVLEYDITPDEAAPLIARGAVVDIFAAAHLGMAARVRELVDADPALVHARGGDGKTPLHCASTVEIAEYLLKRGAVVDARDVDHESTAAQYLVRSAPEVARLLVARGAWVDIFLAVGLGDVARVERCLREDPAALDHRTGLGLYRALHRPGGAIAPQRGDIYRWVFGHFLSAMDVARLLGRREALAQLHARATPAQRLLDACAAADRGAAEAIVSATPGLVATLSTDQQRLIADRAFANDTAAVSLMLDLGFDARVPGHERFEAIRWAAFLGNAAMVARLLRYDPPLNTPDPSFGGTILGNCLYGACHGWAAGTGDFVATVRLLLEAGEEVRPGYGPTGIAAIDALLDARR